VENSEGVSEIEEVQASRLRLLSAGQKQRRTFERTLHDGPQQHLVALAVSVRLARTLAKRDPTAVDEVLAQLGDDVQATLQDLRDLAHRIYPPLLEERGLAHALGAAAGWLAGDVEVDGDLARMPAEIEAAVYFCCTDALERPGTKLRLWQDAGLLRLSVTGDAIDVVHLADCVRAVGGQVKAQPSCVEASIPV
jgi:signal transduction histidine kinase